MPAYQQTQPRTDPRSQLRSQSPNLAPWRPPMPVGGGLRRRIQGARVFASFATILISTRRAAA